MNTRRWTKGYRKRRNLYLCLYLSSTIPMSLPSIHLSYLFIYLPIMYPSSIPVIYVSIIYLSCLFVYLCSNQSLSHVRLFATLWTVARKAPLSMEFSRQEYWSGQPFPSPEDVLEPGIEAKSTSLQIDSLSMYPPSLYHVYLSIYYLSSIYHLPTLLLLSILGISQDIHDIWNDPLVPHSNTNLS